MTLLIGVAWSWCGRGVRSEVGFFDGELRCGSCELCVVDVIGNELGGVRFGGW